MRSRSHLICKYSFEYSEESEHILGAYDICLADVQISLVCLDSRYFNRVWSRHRTNEILIEKLSFFKGKKMHISHADV